ncbi:MAG: phytanoyl-CoA dioxygenase family protein [Saprospiraceae bacterium]|nr:phytanoyl-CoA dioxygenase family protein [Saprospiraceae bacterium]
MFSLGKTFRRYTGLLRSWKAVYIVNNLLNSRRLQHNRELYRKHGLQKSIYAPIGRQDFSSNGEGAPWLDRPGALASMQEHPQFHRFPVAWRDELKKFVEQGYMILRGFYRQESIDLLNEEVDRLLQEGQTDFNYTQRKIMDAFRESELVDQRFFRNPDLLRLLDFTLGRKVVPFQTIHFVEGSEQRAHSDAIHMTTEPQGYLIAAWTALEKTHPGNGPLFFYPGSHRLPFLSCQDYPSGNTRWQIGANSYRNYEEAIDSLIKKHRLKKEFFYAEPGDVLIWHSNLLHGGSPIKEPGATRRSMVAHYFVEDVICYHEISQRPALLDIS